MKTHLTKIRVFLFAVFLLLIGKTNAQTFDCYIANDSPVNASTYEFDVFLKNTSSTTFSFRTIQFAFYVNPAWLPAGPAPTVIYIPASTGLLSYAPGLIQVNSTPSLSGIQIAANSAGACGANTLFTPGLNVKVGRYRISSNSGPMNCVANNISMIRPIAADVVPGGNVNIKMAVTKWTTNDCSLPTSTTISSSGTYTSIAGGTLLGDFNNMRPVVSATTISGFGCSNQGNVTASVSATSVPFISTPITYQWMQNGTPLSNDSSFSGVNGPTLTISNPSATLNNKSYTCVVTQCNGRTSAPAVLSVSNTDDNNVCTTDACDPSTGVVTHTNVANGSAGNSDNLICTSDVCSNGSTVHSAVPTDDSNPCTTDGCDESRGIYHDAVADGSPGMSDGLICTNDVCLNGSTSHVNVTVDDNNVCTTDGCTQSRGVFHDNVTDGSPGNSDGMICTQDICQNGNTIHPAVVVDDNNICTTDACDETNFITHTNVADGTQGMSDGLVCTQDICMNGATDHPPVATDDANTCTTDGCSETRNIFHDALPDGTASGVSDGLVCTDDICVGGNPSFPTVNFNDNNPCTTDGCDETRNIYHDAVADGLPGISDGLICTDDLCQGGSTVNTPVVVDDSNPCTTDGCSESRGVFHDALPNGTASGVSDGLVCTDDVCINGSVSFPAVNVEDNNVCTTDGCDETRNIYHDAVADGSPGMADGLICTDDICMSGSTVNSPVFVDDSNPCTTDGCSESRNIFHDAVTDGTASGVSDGLLCTDDVCLGGVISFPSVNINDNNPCTTDGCDETNGISHDAVADGLPGASDGLICTDDICQSGVTVNAPVPVEDNNPCTTDGCSESRGVYHDAVANGSPGVSDGLLCTDDLCQNGSTVNSVVNVEDSNPCTTDGCDETRGIYHDAVADGLPGTSDGLVCTDDLCLSGATNYTPVLVDDNNPCTTDGCSETRNVYHDAVANGTASGVADGLICTDDVCLNGVVSFPTTNIDDNNACTTDGCDETRGLYHDAVADGSPGNSDGLICTDDICQSGTTVYTAVPIDDGDACTDDACDETRGVTHTAVNISDNDACTTDACDSITGISHTYVNINDNNECTTDGCIPATGIYHTPVIVSDLDSCSIDACDPSTGAISHTDNSPIATASGGLISCYGGTTCVNVSATGGLPPYVGTGSICNVAAGTSSFTIADANGCAVISNSVIIPQPPKLEITGSNSTPAGCASNDGTASVTVTGGVTPYSFVWTPGWDSTQNITGKASGSYVCKVTDANGCTSTRTVVIGSGGSVPFPPASISGPSIVCRGICVTYTIPPVAGATSYQWTIPTGMTGSSTGTSITVCGNSKFVGGYICARALSLCGPGAYTCKTLTKSSGRPNTPSTITGNSYVCANTASTQVYCTQPATNTETINWIITGNSTSPLTIISGQGTNCVTLNVPVGYNGNQTLKVSGSNCSGASSARSLDIKKATAIPNQPGNISGSNSECKSKYNKDYSISSVSNASSYFWTVTGGITITSGQGTKKITVDFRTATSSTAVFSVYAINGCGNSVVRSKTVTVQLNCRSAAEEFETTESISSLTAFPNPTSGKVTIAFNSTQAKYSLRVIDVIGKVLYSQDIDAAEGYNEKELNLENVAKGMYFVTIQSENEKAKTLRLIVE